MTRQTQANSSWNETIRTLIFAVLIAVAFRSFVFEPFHIPSGSMKSTLLVGDYLFVSKYAYGYSRYSFPFSLPLFNGRILEFHQPVRGDIIVFRPPAQLDVDFIKRVMGLPGDELQVKDGIVYINGQPLQREPIDNFIDDEYKNNVLTIPQFHETLPEGKVITILKESHHNFNPIGEDGFTADNTPPFKIPPGYYFMMGDNRDNSHDSRFSNLRFVPAENLVGRAEMMFFSTDGSAQWANPVTWFTAMRLNRFFTFVR